MKFCARLNTLIKNTLEDLVARIRSIVECSMVEAVQRVLEASIVSGSRSVGVEFIVDNSFCNISGPVSHHDSPSSRALFGRIAKLAGFDSEVT